MKTEQIEKIIADQKNAAKKLATALLAAATITTGAAALSSCDETPSVQGSEITSSQTTNEISSETLTETVTEEVTYVNEEDLVNMLTANYPEFENGIWGYNILAQSKGFQKYYTIHPICYDENQEGGSTFIDKIIISQETLEEIKEITGEYYVEYSNRGDATIVSADLPEEVNNYLVSLCFELYTQHFETATPEQ